MNAYQIKMSPVKKMDDGAEFTLIAADVQDARRKAPIVNGGGYAIRVIAVARKEA